MHGEVRVAHIFKFFMLSYYVSLRSETRVVISVTMSAKKRCSVRLYLKLFAGGFIYVICVCLRIVLYNTYCDMFLFRLSLSCVPFTASVSGFSMFDCHFRIL